MSAVVSFDAERVRRYLDATLNGFMNDPADSDYQRGFLAAVLVIEREALGRNDDARLAALDAQVSA